MNADNQQERLTIGFYIAGFVDGEGSFHVAFEKRPSVVLGWQIIPEFHVSQHQSDLKLLHFIQKHLGCGTIRPNHRGNQGDENQVLVVRNRKDLTNLIIPFFIKFKLRSSKALDFEKFKTILELLNKGCHKTKIGFNEIVELAYSMNKGGKYRKRNKHILLESSETIRQTANTK